MSPDEKSNPRLEVCPVHDDRLLLVAMPDRHGFWGFALLQFPQKFLAIVHFRPDAPTREEYG